MESGDFTSEEKNAIIELRERLKNEKSYESPIVDEDLMLYKFLKARNFKLNQAENMLKKHITMRKEYQIDRILLDYKPMEVLELYMSQSFLGFDKEGCPIRYCAAGNMDMTGIFKSASFLDIFKCIVHLIETDIVRTKEQTQKLGKTVSQFIYIYNMENLTLAKALDKKSLDFFMLGASLFQDNYPERLKKVFVLNAPAYFTLPFTILKTVLANDLLNKVSLFGATGWKESLLEDIDEKVLPAFLGGKRTDPDGNPLCETSVNQGYIVPEKYFCINSDSDFSDTEGMQEITIKKQTKQEIDVHVPESGSFIEWDFKVKSKDIGFGLFFKGDENDISDTEEIIPVHRTETSVYPESGIHFCERPGKYSIIFDNSYSWMTDKEILYNIVVKKKRGQ